MLVHEQYTAMVPFWNLLKDAVSSQREVHGKGEIYLPRLDDMTDDQYAAYKLRASFPLFTKHVLGTFIGMVMRKDPLLTNIPNEFLVDIDGSSTVTKTYLRRLVHEFLTTGRAATVVDYSPRLGRAQLLFYDAQSILNWRTHHIGGKEILTLVVLREGRLVVNPDNEFKTDNECLYRVYTLEEREGVYCCRVRVFVGESLESDTYLKSKGEYLDAIPVVIHGGVTPTYPPLLTIAEQNFAWYRLDADYKHGLHYVALPTPYTTGVDPEDKHTPTSIGCSKIWHLPLDATAGMLEFTGAGLGSIATAKEEVYDTIITLSSRILAPPATVNETATAANIRNAGETASLAEIIGSLSDELTKSFITLVNWTQDVEDISVEISTDFIPTVLSGSDVASYVASYLKGGMSFYTLFETLKKGEIQQGDRSLAEELSDIEKEQAASLARELLLLEKTSQYRAKDPIRQGKEGEQFNAGTTFKEN